MNHQLIAARLLGIDPEELKKLINENRIPPEKIFAMKMAVRKRIRGERTEEETATKIKEVMRKLEDSKGDAAREV